MKKAFTMIELVFVIVVMGILAAVIIPSTRTNPLQEAAIQVLSDIRYTQHLAMVDDKLDALDGNWYKKRWQIAFGSSAAADSKPAYTIFSDTSGGSTSDANENEIAINPSNNNQRMTGGYTGANALDVNHADFVGMRKLNLGLSYGVTDITFGGGCNQGTRLTFDYLGRPLKGDLGGNSEAYESDNLIQSDCNVTLEHGSDSIVISIRPETGYANINF